MGAGRRNRREINVGHYCPLGNTKIVPAHYTLPCIYGCTHLYEGMALHSLVGVVLSLLTIFASCHLSYQKQDSLGCTRDAQIPTNLRRIKKSGSNHCWTNVTDGIVVEDNHKVMEDILVVDNNQVSTTLAKICQKFCLCFYFYF